MKKLLVLLSALFFSACATTPKAEYQTGDCLKIAESKLGDLPPQARMMVQAMSFKVLDRGEAYYVFEASILGQVQGVGAVKFEQAEKETDKGLCPGQEDGPIGEDLLEE